MSAEQLPLLLALLATGLLALAIFAPEPAGPPPTVSFAPPLVPERWSPGGPFATAPDPFAELARSLAPPEPPRPHAVWPRLVDPSAANCDAAARLALVDALVTVRAPWADAILERAQADEPDPLVRAAAAARLPGR